MRGELPKDGEENLILMGWTRQGIDWARWGNTTLNTYVTVRYRLDSERYDWNNSIGPGVGIAFDTYNPKGVIAMWGLNTYGIGISDQIEQIKNSLSIWAGMGGGI